MPRPPPVTTTVLLIVLVLLALARVVARILLEIRQRFEAAHAIEEQDAVQMIGLVLDDARRKMLALGVEGLAGAIERRDLDVLRTRHAPAHVGNAEAAFPALDGLIA